MSSSNPPIITKDADIIMRNEGKISFGLGCVVHPKAKIIAENSCNIVFGEFNIIEENVVIKATPRFNPLLNNNETITVYIGSFNHFKVGAYLENTSVENFNVIDFKVNAENCYIESRSIITPFVVLPEKSTVKSGSIVLNKQVSVANTTFNEEDFTKTIKELYKTLASLLKIHKLHNLSS